MTLLRRIVTMILVRMPPLDWIGDGNCVIDTDGDGVCEQDELCGCQDATGVQLRRCTPTDAGYCDFAELGLRLRWRLLERRRPGRSSAMSSRSRVARTTRRAHFSNASNGQRRTHAAMLTLVTTVQATAWWIATAMAHVITRRT